MSTVFYPNLAGAGVIVSGGGSGIGAAIVRAFAVMGAKVGFLDIARDAGEALAACLADAPVPPRFFPCDVTDVAALRSALDAAADAVGTVRVLVNNAALDQRFKLADVEEAEFDRMLQVNLKHVFFASQHVIPGMTAAGCGSIINMTSTGWMRGTLDTQLYAASKAAIVGLTNSLARQVGSAGIRVNAVAPGWVATERQQQLWMTEAAAKAATEQACLKRLPTAADIANAVLFLASDGAAAITKQTLIVDCGTF